jgi:DNA helicase-2/ATP-dependent DNA helicase PcrA
MRLAENPRDLVAGSRVLHLLPGIGPKSASRLMDTLTGRANGDFVVWQSRLSIPACGRKGTSPDWSV